LHVELQNFGRHYDGGVSVAILVSSEFQRGRTIDENATAAVIGILNDPLAATVPADEETV
jgi:hypothetical protein